MTAQGRSINGPSVVAQGGSIQIDSGSYGDTLELSVAGQPPMSSHTLGPDGATSIPVPPVPPGTVLYVSLGRGLNRRVLVIEVVSTGL